MAPPRPRPAYILAAAIVIFLIAALLVAPSRAEVAEPDDRLNVLLVLTDDQTGDSMRAMTFLASKPFGKWVEFDNAFVSTPWCCPTRATILTGQYSYRSGVVSNDGRPLDDGRTLPVWLSDAGYRTGFIGKYLNLVKKAKGKEYVPPGWDFWRGMIDMRYTDFRLNENGTVVPYAGDDRENYLSDVLTAHAVNFIQEPSEEPWFLWTAYRAPHKPTVPAPRHRHAEVSLSSPPPSFNEADVSDKPLFIRRLPRLRAGNMKREVRREHRAMMSVDDGIQDIMSALDETGQLDRTVIVYMTDNGYSRGEHRWHHKKCAYEECVETPLLVRFPPGAKKESFGGLVSSVDIPRTILDIAGAGPGLPPDGESLLPLLSGPTGPWRKSILLNLRSGSGLPAWWAVRTRRWKLVEYDTGETELYDLRNDPHELQSIPANKLGGLRKELAEEIRELRR